MHRLESALQLFVCRPPLHCPPAGYVSGPDRLPDSGIYLGEQGKGHRVIPLAGCDKPSAFVFLYHWSCLPFIMTGKKILRCPSPWCFRGTALSRHVIISQGRGRHSDRGKGIRHSESATSAVTRRIQIRISNAIFSVQSCAACNI